MIRGEMDENNEDGVPNGSRLPSGEAEGDTATNDTAGESISARSAKMASPAGVEPASPP